MAVYICSRCGTAIEKNSLPNPANCPKGGGHTWYKITDGSLVPKPGLHPFQCSKCSTIVYSKNQPNSGACHLGGGHLWRKI